jgi:hemoglobin
MRILPLLAAPLLVAACAAQTVSPQSLYLRLGGQAGVERIARDLVDRTVADPRTSRSFKDVKLDRVKEKLAEQLCEISGGPCKYTGDPMKPVHQGLKVTEAEFYLMVEFLRDVLDRGGVAEDARNELLRALAPMKRDIVFG